MIGHVVRPRALTLGLIDHGIDTPDELGKAIALAPKHGHLIAEKEEVPRLDHLIAELHSRGYVIEGETKMKLSVAGINTRVLVKFKPKESLFVKLKNLAGVILPIVKLF